MPSSNPARSDPITEAALIPTPDTTARPPRARGSVALSVKPGGDEGPSRLGRLRQAGSLKCLFPRRDGASVEAVLVNTAGGITGGDRFEIAAHVEAGAGLTLTTQAAERAYAAGPRETGRLDTRLDVAAGGRLCWIPQETILFDRSALSRRLTVTLAPGATALVVEPLIFGRAAMGEEVRNGRFDDRIDIRRDGVPLYRDAVRMNGDLADRLDRPHTGNGARAMVSLIYVAADAEAQLDPLRRALPATGGASLIGGDVLALRLLAEGGFELRRSLIPILTRLTRRLGGDLPKPWMI